MPITLDRDIRRMQNAKESSIASGDMKSAISHSPTVRSMSDGEQVFAQESNKQLALYKKSKGSLWKVALSMNGNQFVEKDLDVNGALTVNGASIFAAVSCAAISTSGTLDYNNGTIDLSTQTVDVTLNNAVDALNFDSNTLSIDASGNKVGIGTAAPAVKLNIDGGSDAQEGTANTGYLIIGSASGQHIAMDNNEIMSKSDGTTGATLYINAGDSGGDAGGNLILNVHGGAVGIGTASPSSSADLTLEGGVIALKETLTPAANTNYGKIYTKSDNKLYFQAGNNTEYEISLESL
jgi:hypothetical protein